MSQAGPSDKSSLTGPSTYQSRRKRGLSLRSQLFNKAITNQGQEHNNPTTTNKYENSQFKSSQSLVMEANDMQQQTEQPGQSTIELNDLSKFANSSMNNKSNAAATPQISIDDSALNMTGEIYKPYNTLNSNLSRSTTHLTVNTNISEISTTSFISRRRKMPHNGVLSSLIKFKNKVLGINNLPSTENGRIIPLSTNHSEVNQYFQEEFYDKYHKSFIDERRGEPYCNNVITSSKYTVYSFLPKQLRAQFSKIANCYFMTVAIMQMIPTWSTTGQFTTIVPLLIFMSISIAREGYDDWKRHVQDKEENNKRTIVVKEDENLSNFDTHSITTIMTETMAVNTTLGNHSSSSLSSENEVSFSYTNTEILKRYNLKEYPTKWKNVKVGDIVKVNENEWFPADMVLLATSDENQEAFVETMALDGETNLKAKTPHVELSKYLSRVSGLKNIKTLITVEDPNIDLYNFEGHFTMQGETFALGLDNVVYRGSILRNTKSVLGLVAFTGEETKIRMNNIKNPRTKAPKLQRNINYIVIFMVCVVILLSAFSTMAQRILYNNNREKAWYLFQQDAGVAPTLMSFIIMYNTLIPLSLYVTMEIIKVMQLCFLQFDIDMYHVESNTPADAKTATILEELGQVSYIFSDKTGTLTDNLMIFRKFSVCGVSWLHDLDLMLKERQKPNNGELSPVISSSAGAGVQANGKSIQGYRDSLDYNPRHSTTSIVRESFEMGSINSNTTWISTAQPTKLQDSANSLQLLKYIQSHPQTIFAKKAKFFLLSIALCNTCLPRKEDSISRESSKGSSTITLDEYQVSEDGMIKYQAASPDELALVQAARDLGYVVIDRQTNKLIIKTYPNGFGDDPKLEEYQVLDVIEFTSARKRMSIIVKFPDNRICLICKGADNVILEKLKNSELAKLRAKEISLNSADRRTTEADLVLQTKLSNEIESRKSINSLRQSLSLAGNDPANGMNSIDNYLMNKEDDELADIAAKAMKSLHSQQAKRYSLDATTFKKLSNGISNIQQTSNHHMQAIPNDKLLLNEEFIIEKTLEHIEEFSREGLRTLLYSFRWLDKNEYEKWTKEYNEAKTDLEDRAKKVEEVGERIEYNLDMIGATAIEDKLQEGVSEAIDKLRRAGIKMWMLTGDKRETAINIGYSCRLIKDYSTVVILTNDEGTDALMQRITSAGMEIQAGRVAHCVLVIDGATLTDIENDSTLLSLFLELCVQVDSTICCRASPSQKASMVSAVRNLKKEAVTLAIGDGANDIAMIQSADIGVGITGKEGLQAARSADYAIAQFRFLLKLLLVNGRYNYVRTSKFVLCTFYKELLFYLTQVVYQRNTLFSGSSMYESWSLSMFNTLFTSLPVICIGMFDKDLKPATLLAVPELYSKGRLYQAFNLKIFISWMILAALQSVGISFLASHFWGSSALLDNTTFPLGTLVFASLIIVINAKCEFIEMQNRQWLAFAAFIISVGGYCCWNVLIMFLYRSKDSTIFFVAYGLTTWGRDQSWWATLVILVAIALLFDIFIKVLKFMFSPSDDDIFRLFEKDIGMRRSFERKAYEELKQGWTFSKDQSTTKTTILKGINLFLKTLGLRDNEDLNTNQKANNLQQSSLYRKRAGTNPNPIELSPGSGGEVVESNDYENYDLTDYEILPSGKRIKIKREKKSWYKFGNRLRSRQEPQDEDIEDEDVDAIINERLNNLRQEEEGIRRD